jgi:hypothetical protein
LQALIGNDADRAPGDTAIGRDDGFAVVGFVFLQRMGINDGRQ